MKKVLVLISVLIAGCQQNNNPSTHSKTSTIQISYKNGTRDTLLVRNYYELHLLQSPGVFTNQGMEIVSEGEDGINTLAANVNSYKIIK